MVRTNTNGTYNEVTYDSFERTFTLNDDADTNSCKALFENGVLTVNFSRKNKESKEFEVEVC